MNNLNARRTSRARPSPAACATAPGAR